MESKDTLKQIDIKNWRYHDIIVVMDKDSDLDFSDT